MSNPPELEPLASIALAVEEQARTMSDAVNEFAKGVIEQLERMDAQS